MLQRGREMKPRFAPWAVQLSSGEHDGAIVVIAQPPLCDSSREVRLLTEWLSVMAFSGYIREQQPPLGQTWQKAHAHLKNTDVKVFQSVVVILMPLNKNKILACQDPGLSRTTQATKATFPLKEANKQTNKIPSHSGYPKSHLKNTKLF